MEKLMKSFLRSAVVSSLILLALGLLLVFKSEATIYTISYVIGGLLIAVGAIALIKFIVNIKSIERNYDLNIIYGIVCVIMGVIVIEHPRAIASIIPIVLGIVIIASSATKLQYTLQFKDKGSDLWKATIIISLISLLCGVVLIFNPFKVAVGITRIVGIFIAIYAVLDIASTFSIKKAIKEVEMVEESKVVDAEIIDEKEKNKKSTTKTKGKTKKKNAK
ncbi:MAG: DUF308 domain-containing protein [Bacilli bacterium]|nr:DUF308 domain-containing protein [Bacilli bacterium]